jgi:hypothetical protein
VPSITQVSAASCSSVQVLKVGNFDPTLTYTISPNGSVDAATGDITAAAGTGYTVTAKNGSGWKATSAPFALAGQLSVPTAPTVAQTAQTFCNAATVANLLSNGTGVKWYAAATGGTALASATALSTGTYYASQTTNGCESNARTAVSVTVKPLLQGSFDTVICSGASYPFNGLNRTASGVYKDTLTGSNGCDSIVTLNLTVKAAPTVTQSAIPAICSNSGNLTLSGGSPAGGVYSGTGVVGAVFSPSAGTQAVTYSYTENGCTGTAATTITVNPAPMVSFISPVNVLCPRQAPLTLTGGTPAGGVYSGAGVSDGVMNPAMLELGDYPVNYSYTDNKGCENSAAFVIKIEECSGIATEKIFQLHVYPNPTRNVLHIESEEAVTMYELYNAIGSKVAESSADAIEKIDISHYSAGVYLLKLTGAQGHSTMVRVVKE